MNDYEKEIDNLEAQIMELEEDKIGWFIVSVLFGVLLVVAFCVSTGGGA